MKKGKIKETQTKKVENAPEEKISIKGFFISIIVILVVLTGFYFLTVKIMDIRDSKNKEDEPIKKEVVSVRKLNDINYSDLDKMVTNTYFVLFDRADDEKNSEYDLYINTLNTIDSFEPSFYYIDLSKKENKDLLAKKQNLKSLKDIKVKDTTLIYVENGEISKKYIGSKEILDFFSKFFNVEETENDSE